MGWEVSLELSSSNHSPSSSFDGCGESGSDRELREIDEHFVCSMQFPTDLGWESYRMSED